MDTYELKVHSEGYGETICVVDLASFLKGRRLFPCGDGNDYRLLKKDTAKVFARIRKYGQDAYTALESKHSKEVNEFPMAFAFDMKQFEEGMRELGLDPSDTDKVCRFDGGGFVRRSDADRFREMFARHAKERKEAIDGDPTGDGYIYGMFYCQLNNHEYTYTYDPEDTLDSLKLSWDDVNEAPKLLHGLNTAMEALGKADVFG